MERYRSGHNELHSKCSVPPGTVGSNPTLSAIRPLLPRGFFILCGMRTHGFVTDAPRSRASAMADGSGGGYAASASREQ